MCVYIGMSSWADYGVWSNKTSLNVNWLFIYMMIFHIKVVQ